MNENAQEPKLETAAKTAIEKSPYLQLALPISIIIAALLISGSLFYAKTSPQNAGQSGQAVIGDQLAKVEMKINADDHILGSKNAKVTIIEYSDFQCPFCRRFWKESLPQLKKEYIDTGKAVFVYRHYPLDFHPGAFPAAKASECAAELGKFWELHDKIFQEQDKLGQGTVQFTAADIKNWAGQIGLEAGNFNRCLDSAKYDKRVSGDLESGAAAGVSGTPTVFISGQRIVGAQPYANFKAVIDSLLK